MSSNAPDFLWVEDLDEQSATPSSATDTAAPKAPRIPGLPAEPGLWVFVLGDMTVFGWFFLVFMWEYRQDRPLFAASSAQLHWPIGVANTFVLLISSLFVVLALHAHRQGDRRRARLMLTGTGLCALIFGGLKAVEYTLEISAGHSPAQNSFYLFYFALTGIHLIHVVIGAGLIAGWSRMSHRGREWAHDRAFAEGAAVYWHMVDLLWIVIFTLVYLVSSS